MERSNDQYPWGGDRKHFRNQIFEKRMEDAITFVAQKRAVNLPALYMKSLSYDGGKYIENLLPKYLGATSSKLNAWIMEYILVGMVKRVFEPG